VTAIDPVVGLARLRAMITIRVFEDLAATHYEAGRIRGFLHLYDGEEAVACGALEALTPDDNVVATYREHGQALLRGVDATTVFAELFGRATGCSGGRGGSMHLFSVRNRLWGGNAIVGGGIPMAAGLALADQTLARSAVTACFFGDGATDEGVFHEVLNLAALWKLPLLFLCENNHYAMGTALERHAAQVDLARSPRALGIPSERVDGMDVDAVARAVGYAASCVREGAGPRFLELECYRLRAHSMYDAGKYRDEAEVAEWRTRCPIARWSERLARSGVLDEAGRRAMEDAIRAELSAAAETALAAPIEPVEGLLDHVDAGKAT
jgi:pyruvate dehydrogenase E1 component alpha subunit